MFRVSPELFHALNAIAAHHTDLNDLLRELAAINVQIADTRLHFDCTASSWFEYRNVMINGYIADDTRFVICAKDNRRHFYFA